jgi:Tol biopolymer transport system component
VLVLTTALPEPQSAPLAVAQPGTPQTDSSSRVLAPARGQVAWLDLVAPRPTPLTQLAQPTYPADVAGAPGVPFAVASIVGGFPSAPSTLGGDLVLFDLQSGASRPLLSRQSDEESLDLPAVWPDGSGVLYQRSNLKAAIPMPGQAQPQYRSRVEQLDADGQTSQPLLDDARYPGPAPDGSRFAFVRSTDRGAGIFVHSIADGSDSELVPSGQFLALAYPRFSPDGQHLAFAAVRRLAPIGRGTPPLLTRLLGRRVAEAHGFPWEIWLVEADGTDLRQVPDVVNDDPSVTWSPDGGQLLIYGGWGSFLVDLASDETTSLPFVAGYGSVAWLSD